MNALLLGIDNGVFILLFLVGGFSPFVLVGLLILGVRHAVRAARRYYAGQ